MLEEYKNKTNIGIGLGILLESLGILLFKQDYIIGVLLVPIGIILFFYGCFSYAKGKGYHPAFGLLALLNLLGLIILILLPDKHKNIPKEGHTMTDSQKTTPTSS